MKIVRKMGWRELIVLLAALACAGSWAAGQVRSMRNSAEVAHMTGKMKTICVGRHLVDVPAQADIVLSHERIAGFAVETIEESEAAFRQRIAARETEIAAQKPIGGISVSLSDEYADEGAARLAETLLARVRPRDPDEIPSAAGFCIWRAVFAEPLPVRKAEHSVMHLGLPGHPDLAMTFVSMPGGGLEADLLARSGRTEASMGADLLRRLTRLRAARRSIHGIDGEELVVRAREYNFATTYGLNWESRGVADNPLQPYLLLELQTGLNDRPGGRPVDTSLREDALLSLWDSIASSIRLRPVGPG